MERGSQRRQTKEIYISGKRGSATEGLWVDKQHKQGDERLVSMSHDFWELWRCLAYQQECFQNQHNCVLWKCRFPTGFWLNLFPYTLFFSFLFLIVSGQKLNIFLEKNLSVKALSLLRSENSEECIWDADTGQTTLTWCRPKLTETRAEWTVQRQTRLLPQTGTPYSMLRSVKVSILAFWSCICWTFQNFVSIPNLCMSFESSFGKSLA